MPPQPKVQLVGTDMGTDSAGRTLFKAAKVNSQDIALGQVGKERQEGQVQENLPLLDGRGRDKVGKRTRRDAELVGPAGREGRDESLVR